MSNRILFKSLRTLCIVFLLWMTLPDIAKAQSEPATSPVERVLFSDTFSANKLEGWKAYGAEAVIEPATGGGVLKTQGDSQVFWGGASDQNKLFRDVTVEGDVSVERYDVNSGFMVRASKQGVGNNWSGYYACYRKLADYAIVQLFRFPDFVLLQEARVRGAVNANQLVHLKVTCKGSSIWVWANDMSAPAITEFDDKCSTPGLVGLKADNNKAGFDNIVVSTPGATPHPPLVSDWSWVKGAIFITSDSVNSYQMWEEYHPKVIDRELFYARFSGLNTVQVYLNFLTWQKYGQLYLDRIEDFLQRAKEQGLKVTFIFFDDVGNIEPPHLSPYQAPVAGVHNSQMQGSPGRDIVDNRYGEHREQLKAYVQAVVNAHKSDSRIIFWQTYNEPSHATTLPLLVDSYQWIKETGSTIPVSATGGGAFYGSYYSDFPTFHSYLDPHAPATQNMVLGDGGAEHLCTETLDRPGVDMPKLVNYFSTRKTGWIVWELMIGRDNCRFPWGSPPGAQEPATPFHGLIYPDGHPWSLDDIKLIRGNDLRTLPGFNVDYYSDIHFGSLKKSSVVPRLDFDLDTEPGTAASDASVGIEDTGWSNRYSGKVSPVQSGIYTFAVDSDGLVRVWIDAKQIISKIEMNARKEIHQQIRLRGGRSYRIVVEYAHEKGPANLHLRWSGPGIRTQVLASAQ